MPYPKGKRQTVEHRNKIRRALAGIKRSDYFRAKLSTALKGRKLSDETKARISQNRRGKGIGNKNGLGKNLLNQNAKGKTTGSDNGNWNGGNSPYYRRKNAPRPKPSSCEVCGAVGRICFDHDHLTGEFRGWICSRCNVALGMVRDNSETLIALANYLNGVFYKHNSDQTDIQPEKKD